MVDFSVTMVSTTRFAQCLLVPVLPTSRRTPSLLLSQQHRPVALRSLTTSMRPVAIPIGARCLPTDDEGRRPPYTISSLQMSRSTQPQTRRRPRRRRAGDFPPFHGVPRSSCLDQRRSITSNGASRMIDSSASEDDNATPSRRHRPAAMTKTAVRRLRVAELREELRMRGLDDSGLKDALVDRLNRALSNVSERVGLTDTNEDAAAPDSKSAELAGGKETMGRGRGGESEATATAMGAAIAIDPDVTYVLRFDGGSRGNPGAVAGAGMVLYDGRTGGEVWSGRRFLGGGDEDDGVSAPGGVTNNEAEYVGLVTGLRCALELGVRRIEAQGDSLLVVKQVGGTYRCRKASLRPLYEEAVDLSGRFDSFQLGHIPREENARADELANRAMDESKSVGLDVLKKNSSNNEAFVAKPEATGGKQMEGAKVSPRDPKEESRLGLDTNDGGSANIIDPGKTYVLLFCGRSHGNPAAAGAGAALVDSTTGREIWTGGRFLGSAATHHEAAYEGLLAGLRHAREIGVEYIAVRGNCDLVVKQLEGKYRCKDAKLQPLFLEATKLIGDDFASVQMSQIPKDENLRAAGLAKEAIDRKESFGV